MAKPRVVVAGTLPEPGLELLRGRYDVEVAVTLMLAAGRRVCEGEPDVPQELRELPYTVLTPHIGSATGATRDAMARLVAQNVIAVVEGREPPAPVV